MLLASLASWWRQRPATFLSHLSAPFPRVQSTIVTVTHGYCKGQYSELAETTCVITSGQFQATMGKIETNLATVYKLNSKDWFKTYQLVRKRYDCSLRGKQRWTNRGSSTKLVKPLHYFQEVSTLKAPRPKQSRFLPGSFLLVYLEDKLSDSRITSISGLWAFS